MMDNGNLLASNVDYLKDGLAVLGELDRARKNRERLENSLKALEREIAGEEKACSDEIEITLKKRREEISASFDREIRNDQEKVRRARTEREKAKDKGVAGRIEAETADLREENRKTKEEIKAVLKQNHLPHLCNTKLYFGIFSPKEIVEYLIFSLTFLMMTVLLPLLIFLVLPVTGAYSMLAICFLCYVFFFLCYQAVAKKTRINKGQAISQVRALRDKLRANDRRIKAVKNVILKDKNEQGYNLEKFDEEILNLETEVRCSMDEKNEALTVFDETTKTMLMEDIRGRYQEKITALIERKNEADKSLKEADSLVKDINKHVTANYEAFLGKDYVTERALQDMIALMEEKGASTVAEALALYKSEH